MKKRFADRVVIVSGGARGIGLATARAFADQGASVAICDVDGELACREAESLGGLGCAVDVRDRIAFKDLVEQVRGRFGEVDVLVNNAGIMPTGAFHEEPAALTDAQIDINLRGVIHGMQAVLPSMLARQSGHIVNVASMAGRLAIPGLAVYCATKHAVVALTESAAAEYRDTGLHFTAIMPSKVRTELASGSDVAAAGIPAVDPEDVAQAILQSVLKPQLFVSVPRYLDGASALYRLLPVKLAAAGRRLLRDDRVLNKLDYRARKAYTQRLQLLAGPRQKGEADA